MDKKNLELAVQLRRELHAHPELSYQETWTKQHLMDFIKNNTKNLRIEDRGRWFYAVYEAGPDKPSVAFRGDFDALPIDESACDFPHKSTVPGVAHKCGHDGHAASVAGLALEVDQNGCDKNVYFLDGGKFFDGPFRDSCTVDGCHPNDLGFLRMAQGMYPTLKEILGL